MKIQTKGTVYDRMIPYIILLFAPLLFFGVTITVTGQGKDRKRLISLGMDREIINHSLVLPVFFILLFMILALRDESIGRDLENYHSYFDQYSSWPLKSILSDKKDVLYLLLNWVVGQFTSNYQIFIVIVAAITVIPLARLYCEDREYGFLKMILFLIMPTFAMLFSGLRQAIAMAVGLIAYEYVRKKKFFRFVITVIIAWGFHHTAFMLLALYPLYHLRLKKKHLWFIVPIILLIFIFNAQIFLFLTSILASLFGEKYEAGVEPTGALTMLILFILFAVVSYVLPDEKALDQETIGLRNLLLLSVLLQCFAPVHSLAMRMNFYYILFIPMLIPKILKHAHHRFGDVARLAKIVMIVFFTGYYLYTTYVSCQTGISALDTYPYRFFWEN